MWQGKTDSRANEPRLDNRCGGDDGVIVNAQMCSKYLYIHTETAPNSLKQRQYSTVNTSDNSKKQKLSINIQ